jgi:hypothetical protein
LYFFVSFLLGNSPASEFCMPTFRNTLFLHHTYPPMKMEETVCSEMLANKFKTPGNYPEESIQHSEHGESLKSRSVSFILMTNTVVRKQDVSKRNELNIYLCISVSVNISVKIAAIRLGVLISNSGT